MLSLAYRCWFNKHSCTHNLEGTQKPCSLLRLCINAMLDGCISRCLGDLLLFKELALGLQEGQGRLNPTDRRVQRAPIGIAREQIWQRLQTSRKDTDTSKQLNYYLLHLVALLQPSNGKVSFGNLRKSVPSNRSDWHKESGCTGDGTQWRLWGICQQPAGKDTYSLLTTVSFLLLFQFSFLLKCLLFHRKQWS